MVRKGQSMAENMQALDHVTGSWILPLVEISIEIEKVCRYATYKIESIRIENKSQKTIRLRKIDLVGLGGGRTLSLGKTILKKGDYTKAIRLVLN